MSFHDPDCQETLNAALALVAQGIAVFPLKYCTKEPATNRGFYDATTNPATIRRWFGGNFKRNLAVRTGAASGVWVFDEDDPDSLKALVDRYEPLPVTRQSRSSRGAHHWFKTTDIPIPNSTSRIGPGLDVKSEGGYVVVPPSIHPDGVVYSWVNNEPIAEAPQWLVELARKPPPPEPPRQTNSPQVSPVRSGPYGAIALRNEISILTNTPKGSRNHALNRSSFALHQLVAGGELSATDVERELLAAVTANGLLAEDGMRQCLATIRSGAHAGTLHPRTRHGGGA